MTEREDAIEALREYGPKLEQSGMPCWLFLRIGLEATNNGVPDGCEFVGKALSEYMLRGGAPREWGTDAPSDDLAFLTRYTPDGGYEGHSEDLRDVQLRRRNPILQDIKRELRGILMLTAASADTEGLARLVAQLRATANEIEEDLT